MKIRVTNKINKGTWFWNFEAWLLKFQENVAFIKFQFISHTVNSFKQLTNDYNIQSICTFACEQILRKFI